MNIHMLAIVILVSFLSVCGTQALSAPELTIGPAVFSTPTDTSIPISEMMVYYFLSPGEYLIPEEKVVIASEVYILAPTLAVSLTGNTFGNLWVSNNLIAKAADYVFTRTEVEAFMN